MLVEEIHKYKTIRGVKKRRPLGDPRIPDFQNNENKSFAGYK